MIFHPRGRVIVLPCSLHPPLRALSSWYNMEICWWTWGHLRGWYCNTRCKASKWESMFWCGFRVTGRVASLQSDPSKQVLFWLRLTKWMIKASIVSALCWGNFPYPRTGIFSWEGSWCPLSLAYKSSFLIQWTEDLSYRSHKLQLIIHYKRSLGCCMVVVKFALLCRRRWNYRSLTDACNNPFGCVSQHLRISSTVVDCAEYTRNLHKFARIVARRIAVAAA